MDKDRIDGIGKATADTRTQAEGTAENAVGGARDTVRDTLKD